MRKVRRHVAHAMTWWRRRLPAWLLTVLTVGAVLWLTLAPQPLPDNDIPLFPGADKLVHAAMFGGVTLVLWADWRMTRHRPLAVWQTALCAVIAIALGGAIEIAQGTMNLGRSADFADFVADTIGSLAVMAILLHRPSRR